MKNTRAALRYAKAVLSTAIEGEKETDLAKDMQSIVDVFAENNDLVVFLENPVVPNSTKKASLEKIFTSLQPLSVQLMDLLSRNNRIDLLDQVAASFLQLLQKHQGKKTATVTTAVALSPTLEKVVLAKAKELSSAEISLENSIDPSIIGGFILRIGDLQYNASVAHQLEQFERELTQKNYSA